MAKMQVKKNIHAKTFAKSYLKKLRLQKILGKKFLEKTTFAENFLLNGEMFYSWHCRQAYDFGFFSFLGALEDIRSTKNI